MFDFLVKLVLTTAALLSVCLSEAFSLQNSTYKDLIVVIDAGHGGEDVGAKVMKDGKIITEKELTLILAQKIEKELHYKGIATYMTRSADYVVPLDKRTAAANKAVKKFKEAVFVSIHINSSQEISAEGFETYVFNATTNEASLRLSEVENASFRVEPKGTLSLILSDLTASGNYTDSLRLACRIQVNVIDGMEDLGFKIKDRGVRPGLFYVLMNTQMPGVLIEAGFSTNKKELTLLLDETYQKRLTQKIADGVWRWQSLKNYRKKNPSPMLAKLSGIKKNPHKNDSPCDNLK